MVGIDFSDDMHADRADRAERSVSTRTAAQLLDGLPCSAGPGHARSLDGYRFVRPWAETADQDDERLADGAFQSRQTAGVIAAKHGVDRGA